MIEDDRFPRIQRDQPGEESQQRGLPGAIGAREEHDLARGHVEIDPGQGRKAIEQADGGAKTDDGRHTRLRAMDDKEVYERGG